MRESDKMSPREALRDHFETALKGKQPIKQDDILNAVNSFFKTNNEWAGDKQTTSNLQNEIIKMLGKFNLPSLKEGGLIIKNIMSIFANLPQNMLFLRNAVNASENEKTGQLNTLQQHTTIDKSVLEEQVKFFSSIHPTVLAEPGKLADISKHLQKEGKITASAIRDTVAIAEKNINLAVKVANSPWGKFYAEEGESQKKLMNKFSKLEDDLPKLNTKKKEAEKSSREMEQFANMGLKLDRVSGFFDRQSKVTIKEEKKVKEEKEKVFKEKYSKKVLPTKTEKTENTTNEEKPRVHPVPKHIREQTNKEPVMPTKAPPKLPEDKQMPVKSKETSVNTPRTLPKKLPTKPVFGKHTENIVNTSPGNSPKKEK